MKACSCSHNIDGVQNLRRTCSETESHTSREQLGERVESDDVTTSREDLRFELKVTWDPGLGEEIWSEWVACGLD